MISRMRLTGAIAHWNPSPLKTPNLPHSLHIAVQLQNQTMNWVHCLSPRQLTHTRFHLARIYPQVNGQCAPRGTFAYSVKPCKTATVHQLSPEPSAPASASISTVVNLQGRITQTSLFIRLIRRRTKLRSSSTSSLMLYNPTTSENVSRTTMGHTKSSKPISLL
jgi:hypothetical protein